MANRPPIRKQHCNSITIRERGGAAKDGATPRRTGKNVVTREQRGQHGRIGKPARAHVCVIATRRTVCSVAVHQWRQQPRWYKIQPTALTARETSGRVGGGARGAMMAGGSSPSGARVGLPPAVHPSSSQTRLPSGKETESAPTPAKVNRIHSPDKHNILIRWRAAARGAGRTRRLPSRTASPFGGSYFRAGWAPSLSTRRVAAAAWRATECRRVPQTTRRCSDRAPWHCRRQVAPRHATPRRGAPPPRPVRQSIL